MLIEPLERRLLLSHTWYVATNGSDNAGGTTVTTPFRTIQRAAGLAQAGDTVYIRGGIYHETVTPAHSGTASAPITYMPYGGETVTIDGADPITGWTNYSGSIYVAQQPWDLGTGNNQVFVDGQMINEARWPNLGTDLSHVSTATVSSVAITSPGTDYLLPTTATIYTNFSLGATNAWQNCIIHIGNGQDWVVQTGLILSSTSNSITFTYVQQTPYETPQAGNQFYLTGPFQAIDTGGEWWRDYWTGKLYVRTPASDNAANHTIEAKDRQYAFELSGRSYINVSGIHLFASTIDTSATSTHLQLTGLTAQYVSHTMLDPIPWDGQGFGATTGILLNGSFNVLSNSSIADSSGNGVYVSGSNNTVQSCTIHDVDYAGGDEAGIEVTGSNQQILSNTIYYAGRDGILASAAFASKIDGNTISNVGLQTTDLGGIYTWGTNGRGTEIAYNNISAIHTGGFGAAGVYLDNGSSGYVVHDNNVSNVDTRLKINPPSYSNTIYTDPISYGQQVGAPSTAPAIYQLGSVRLASTGTTGGFNSEASGVNSSGGVVGASNSGSGQPGFWYANGAIYPFPTFGGTYSITTAINDSSQCTGAAFGPSGSRMAFLFSGGNLYNLGVLPGGIGSMGNAINASGQIVGTCWDQFAVSRAFFWSNGQMYNLGTLGGAQSEATGINNAGVVVGSSTLANSQASHAYYFYNGRMNDLGTLGGSSSYALAINNNNVIVGESLVSGNGAFHAFVDQTGRMTDLGTLSGYRNSVATAINDNGDIVGYAWNSDTSTPHAFLVHNGVMRDLNSYLPSNSGWILQHANAINRTGQIAGGGTDPNGQARGFLMTIG